MFAFLGLVTSPNSTFSKTSHLLATCMILLSKLLRQGEFITALRENLKYNLKASEILIPSSEITATTLPTDRRCMDAINELYKPYTCNLIILTKVLIGSITEPSLQSLISSDTLQYSDHLIGHLHDSLKSGYVA